MTTYKSISVWVILMGYLVPSVLYSQQFELQSNEVMPITSSGVSLISADFNSDGLTDIGRFKGAIRLQLFLQTPSGTFKRHFTDESANPPRYWSIVGAHLNEDRWMDFIGAAQFITTYWISNPDGTYNQERVLTKDLFSQASNLVDLDQDGDLDYFIANDVDTNMSFRNDGSFPFVRDRSLVPFTFDHPDDYAGNYGSVWEDLNFDGKADGYISKCFQTATLPSDPRRINQLMLSKQTGDYKDEAQLWNIDDSAQSWSASLFDMENDGDQDLFVINHDEKSYLYIREGSAFRRSMDYLSPTIQTTGIQALPMDFNNDGWTDLFITGASAFYYRNRQGQKLEQQRLPVFMRGLTSAVTGDFNQDGLIDIYGTLNELYNSASDLGDMLWLNQDKDPEKHFISIQLFDTMGRPLAEMATVKCYVDSLSMIRSYRFGQGYGIQQSGPIHFGVGAGKEIDSIQITYLSGEKESYYNLLSDRQYYVVKEQGIYPYRENQLSQDFICEGDTVWVYFPEMSYPLFLFGDSDTIKVSVDSFAITDEGSYFWTGRDLQGNPIRSKPFQLRSEDEDLTRINVSGDISGCEGDSLSLSVFAEHLIRWNNGDTVRTIPIRNSGSYYALVQGNCRNYVTDTIHVNLTPVSSIEGSNDTIGLGESAYLESNYQFTNWYINKDDREPFYIGQILQTNPLTRDTAFYISRTDTISQSLISTGVDIINSTTLYHDNFFDGSLFFSVTEEITLESVTVGTDESRIRVIQLFADGRRVESDTFAIDSGQTVLSLHWSLQPNISYEIKTDRAYSFANYNIFSPRLKYSNNISFPVTDRQYVTIFRSNGGSNDYYYFYDWEMRLPPLVCSSDREKVQAIIQDTTSGSTQFRTKLRIYPNPAMDVLHIQTGEEEIRALSIYSIYGQKLLEQISPSSSTIDISSLASGLFLLTVRTKAGDYTTSFLKF